LTKFDQNLTRTMGTLHEDLHTFKIIPHYILLRMRDFSDKTVEKKHISFSTTSLRNSCC